MPDKVANLCLDVKGPELVVSLSNSGTWYWQVFYSQQDTPAATTGSSVTLPEAGQVRVVVWDGTPPQPTAALFEEPTSIATGISVGYAGADYVVVSAGKDDPWPPA